MFHYVMLELSYKKKHEALTVTNNFNEAVNVLKKVLNTDNEYLKNAFIESHMTEQFEE